jgi:uncharacterized protein (TIGR00369 family)
LENREKAIFVAAPSGAFPNDLDGPPFSIVIAPGESHSGVMSDITDERMPLPFGQAFDMSAVAGNMSKMGHSAWLGVHFHAEGDDWIELALPWKAELAADVETGIIASGPIISLMDSATGISVWKKRGTFLPHVTVDLRVDYMRAARPGRTVIGRGECYRLTRSFAFIRGIAYDETPDDPVAHVVGSYILLGGDQA